MKVLVDTTVWSLALRKKPRTSEDERIIKELVELVRELRVIIVGPVRQELLTGVADDKKFNQLRQKLQAFDDVPLDTATYELAAELSNRCRKHGIQGSHTDFLLCAFAVKNNCSIFTLDKDFDLYKKHLKIISHAVRNEFSEE
jgi:predicted nucleic acid-binding protein